MRCLSLLIAGLVFGVSSVSAQSLADVAKKEQERRQGVKAADDKVYSNKDLKEVPTPAATASAAPAAAPAAKEGEAKADAKDDATKPDAAKADAKKADAKSEPAQDEKYWRERMKRLRDQVEHDKLLADALQSRVNALTTDFVNRDDPSQRALIAIDREKAVSELERMKKAVEDDTVAIASAEEEARRSGVPPGWLR